MINFKSVYFTNYIYTILGKSENDIFNIDLLDSVESITLNGKTLRGIKNDVTSEDLLHFKNLKYCSFVNMEITDNDINILNICSSIISLQFFNCTFKRCKASLDTNIANLSVVSCDNFSIKYISDLNNLKVLNISDMDKVKLNGINDFINLEVLYLQNIKKLNIAPIKFIPSLIYLNLDGSNYKTSKLFNEISLYVKADANKYRFFTEPQLPQILQMA